MTDIDDKLATYFATLESEFSSPKSLYKKLLAHHQSIERSLNNGCTYQQCVDGLNNIGVDISVSTFSNYLHRMRKQSDSQTSPQQSPETPHKRSQRLPPTPPPSTPSPEQKQPQKADKWNETEKLVGYRLPDNIRPYVSVVDGKVVPKFKKGTVMSGDIRDELARLRRVVDRGVPEPNQ